MNYLRRCSTKIANHLNQKAVGRSRKCGEDYAILCHHTANQHFGRSGECFQKIRRSFTRHIRARTGGSFGEWVKRARLARAQELLVGGVRGLDDVAARCGFPDAYALRSAFRTELGLTPVQWLARQRLSASIY